MCGIAGCAWADGAVPFEGEALRSMVRVLEHRGPDDEGFFDSRSLASPDAAGGPGAALGFRRLSIIDLAGGNQPLANEDESVWVVFNGEIYNYRELRSDLADRGHRFRTDSDTETIVHLYEDFGDDCVQHLRGMFAFAIWDALRRRLLLARDRLGQKPLFYRLDGRRLLFGSELKALLQVPGLPRELNLAAVDDFFTYQYVPHPHCILDGYHKLPPGHTASFEDGRLDVRRYWSPPYEPGSEPDDLQGASSWTADRMRTELRERLTESVRLRMRSDVPLGAFLSGGVDSTIIAGLMQSLSQTPVHTFSIGFPVKQFDESAYARMAAEHLGTEHHEQIVDPQALSILPKLIRHYDEPFSDSSAIPTMHLSEMTRRHVTVSLSGDGGDELFAGYDRYRAVQLGMVFDRLPRPVKSLLTARIWQRLPASVEQKSLRRRFKKLLLALGQEPERRYLRWICIMDDAVRGSLYSAELNAQLAGHDSAEFILSGYRHCPSRDFVTRTTCTDVLTYLPCDILTKVDIASMAYSLECRSPFLDHRVAELAAVMPIELKRRGKRGKQILLDTFADLIPEPIRKRPKMGFGVPLDHWFRGELNELLHDTLLAERCTSRGLFNVGTIREMIEQHERKQFDHSYRLWALLVFELWQQTYLDCRTPPAE